MKYIFEGKTFYMDELERYYAWRHKARYVETFNTRKKDQIGFVVTTANGNRLAFYHKRINYRYANGIKAWLIEPTPTSGLWPNVFNQHIVERGTALAEREAGI